MVKGMYHYLREAWKKPDMAELRKKMINWRNENSIVRIEKPTRLDRARTLGYKAKKGFVVVRVRLKRGGRKRPKRRKGRSSAKQTIKKHLNMNYQWVAEQRAARRYKNLEVLNSYWLSKDGIYYWFEVILVDPKAPEIFNDKKMKWIANKKNRGRVFRGLTSSAKKSRGLR